MNKPYSESCDQNRKPILSVIQPLLKDCSSLLEIGSGTGQHAVFFAEKMPRLTWHTSDCVEYLPGIQAWIADAKLENVQSPFILDVSKSTWPAIEIDAIFVGIGQRLYFQLHPHHTFFYFIISISPSMPTARRIM